MRPQGLPDEGIAPGTRWEDVPINWTCPSAERAKRISISWKSERTETHENIHTMLRVGDLKRSIAFYTNVLGMRLLRQKEYPDGRSRSLLSAMTTNRDRRPGTHTQLGYRAYELGTGYGHVAMEVDDAYKACEEVRQRGGKVTREAGPMKHGTTVIAFVEDPDGYKIEFIQKKH
jgi:lactoylglutathione lyase